MNDKLPRHIAIIMDGNGRWAKRRGVPRIAGHRAGVDAVRHIIDVCAKRHIEHLTLFAFSSENWQRPVEEVAHLMDLFLSALKRELAGLQRNNVCIRIIGDRSKLNGSLCNWIDKAEMTTQHNTGLKVTFAVNYGGRWDIVNAMKHVVADISRGALSANQLNDTTISTYLSMADYPEPDLLIRTSGEKRISNFLIWQIAYTELYFTDVLWPDFNEQSLETALAFFADRERRFGSISSKQLQEELQVQSA